MNGIKNLRDGAFGLTLFALFGALLYEYGKRRETVEYRFERWTAYQENCLKVALAALIVSIVLSLVLWLGEKSRRARRRADAFLVTTTEKRVTQEIFDNLEDERLKKEALFARMGCDRNGYPIKKT